MLVFTMAPWMRRFNYINRQFVSFDQLFHRIKKIHICSMPERIKRNSNSIDRLHSCIKHCIKPFLQIIISAALIKMYHNFGIRSSVPDCTYSLIYKLCKLLVIRYLSIREQHPASYLISNLDHVRCASYLL